MFGPWACCLFYLQILEALYGGSNMFVSAFYKTMSLTLAFSFVRMPSVLLMAVAVLLIIFFSHESM